MDFQALRPTSFHTSYTTAGLLTLLLIFCSLYRRLRPLPAAGEPPIIRSFVPFVGHLISLVRKGCGYLNHLDQKYPYSIYTLPVLGSHQYVVCSPEWLNAIHRNSKTISFNDLVVQVMEKVFLQDKRTMTILRQNANNEDGHRSGPLLEQHDMIGSMLRHGEGLDTLTKAVLKEEAVRLNRLAREHQSDTIKLWDWLRHNLSMASMNAIYGPENPFALHETLMDDFWQFDKDVVSLLMMPWPRMTVKKGYLARNRLFDAWFNYFEKGKYKHAAEWIQRRVEINVDNHGISLENFAASEVSMNIAILSNTIPTAFWLLSHILSRPSLHSDIRSELTSCISPSSSTINLATIKSSCPLLLSTFRETMRCTAYLNSARIVNTSTTISNRATGETYLLKKGSMLQIATNLIHFNKNVYGDDADEFKPQRFLHMDENVIEPAAPFRDVNGKTHSGALRSFGSGNAICLGRHLATSEILGLVALFVVGFEVGGDANGEGNYTPPSVPRFRAAGGGIPHPEEDLEVSVRRRIGYEDIEWEFELEASY